MACSRCGRDCVGIEHESEAACIAALTMIDESAFQKAHKAWGHVDQQEEVVTTRFGRLCQAIDDVQRMLDNFCTCPASKELLTKVLERKLDLETELQTLKSEISIAEPQ